MPLRTGRAWTMRMNSAFYSEGELAEAYREIGVAPGRVVYVTGNLGRLGLIKDKDKSDIIRAHFEILEDLLGEKGTLVVPTHSFSICNTDVPFSISSTPSETGPFTEYVRNQKGAVRQYHAFSSSTAIGAASQDICGDCARHVYGYHTPFQRMVDADAIFVSVGMPASSAVSLVHHAEFLMGVPYRYTKEFEHPVEKSGSVVRDVFYLYVIYGGIDIKRDRNVRIFSHFSEHYRLSEARLGLSGIQGFLMGEFMDATTSFMKDDIYAWLAERPNNRPYRN